MGHTRALGPIAAVSTVVAVVAVVAVAASAGAASSSPARHSCPLPASGKAPEWSFSARVSPIYIHGRGAITPTRATGTACQRRPNADLVLAIHGRATLTRGISSGGAAGTQLTLPVRVTATDFPVCPVRTRGTLTLFAAHSAAEHDSIRLTLPACFGEELGGSGVRVSLPR